MPLKSRFPPIEVPQANIIEYIFPPGEDLPDNPIWIDSETDENALSLRELQLWTKRIAVGLDALGIKRGTVVMVYTPNHIFIPAAYLGIVGSGRIFSGMNPAFTLPEAIHQVRDSQAQVLLAHPALLSTAIAAAKAVGLPLNRVFQFSDAPSQTKAGIHDWRQMLGDIPTSTQYQFLRLSPSEARKQIATINYSSGTTGVPKGVCVTHHNVIANVCQLVFMQDPLQKHSSRQLPQERWIGFLPLYHAYGQLFTILIAAKLRIPVYVMRNFVLTDFLGIIQTKKITHLQAVPPILIMLAKRPEVSNYDLRSLTEIFSGAAPLSKELQNEISARFNVIVNQGWGMTELTLGGLKSPVGMKDDSGSVGVILPNCEVKLLDDSGEEVGIGERGELFIRGPNVCLGYWRNEEATKALIDAEGWLRTGDVALYDSEGRFWIVDRKKELIKVNGIQVAPAELEATLLEHPHVADAAVVGITFHGEEHPRAYIVLKENSPKDVTEASIQQWIKTRVARYKYLTGGISFVPEIPKLASGKITRKIMREWAIRDANVMEGRIKARL